MATVYRDPRARPKINYITTAPFNANFYNYTQSTNPNTFEVTGALSAVSGVSPSVCPRGRVLRENGKRLFPGGSYPGVSTFMVGVFDANSGLSGYIDPNAEVFAYYNVDKPVEVVDGVDPSGNVVHRGPSMYTSGNILADGNLDVGGYADVSGNLTVAGTADISGALTVASGGASITGGASILTGDLSVSTGKLFLPGSGANASVGVGNMASGTIAGGFRRLTINTTAVRTTSRIFLTYAGQNNVGVLSAESIVNLTSFQIVSNNTSDAGTVNWLIIN